MSAGSETVRPISWRRMAVYCLPESMNQSFRRTHADTERLSDLLVRWRVSPFLNADKDLQDFEPRLLSRATYSWRKRSTAWPSKVIAQRASKIFSAVR